MGDAVEGAAGDLLADAEHQRCRRHDDLRLSLVSAGTDLAGRGPLAVLLVEVRHFGVSALIPDLGEPCGV